MNNPSPECSAQTLLDGSVSALIDDAWTFRDERGQTGEEIFL
jgi:hypothetical protein